MLSFIAIPGYVTQVMSSHDPATLCIILSKLSNATAVYALVPCYPDA